MQKLLFFIWVMCIKTIKYLFPRVLLWFISYLVSWVINLLLQLFYFIFNFFIDIQQTS